MPPEIITFTRPSTCPPQHRERFRGQSESKPSKSSSSSGRWPKRRIDSTGPFRAKGGMIALTRGRRAGERRPSAIARRCGDHASRDAADDVQQVLVVGEYRVGFCRRPNRSTYPSRGPLTRMSVTSGSCMRARAGRGRTIRASSSSISRASPTEESSPNGSAAGSRPGLRMCRRKRVSSARRSVTGRANRSARGGAGSRSRWNSASKPSPERGAGDLAPQRRRGTAENERHVHAIVLLAVDSTQRAKAESCG